MASMTQLNVPLPTPLYRQLKALAESRRDKLYVVVEDLLTEALVNKAAASSPARSASRTK